MGLIKYIPKKYLLEVISGVKSAFSLKKLSKKYNASCMRVRRSSDNAEQDIGFSGNDLNRTELLSFTGINDGFMSVLYNQAGTSHLTRTTASKQGKIVSGGNAENSVLLDGVDDNYYHFLSSISGSFTICTQLDLKSSASNQNVWTVGLDFPGNKGYALRQNSSNTLTVFNGSQVLTSTSSTSLGLKMLTFILDTNAQKIKLYVSDSGGTVEFMDRSITPVATANTNHYLGAENGTTYLSKAGLQSHIILNKAINLNELEIIRRSLF